MATTRRKLLDLLASLGRAMQGDLRLRAGSAQLQPVHLQSLLYLRQANRYSNTPQALTEYLGLTKGTVSQSLLWLYRRGLVERQPDVRDGRVVRLALSAEALALLEEKVTDRAWERAAGELSRADAQELLGLLTRLLRELQAQRGGRSFGVCETCAHLRRETARRLRCGLTGDELSREDSKRICREHSVAAARE